jgi:ankyrin repeat protein
LISAASKGDVEVARFLLAHGSNPNARDEAGVTPLLRAAEGDFIEIAKLLLSHGADVDASCDEYQWTNGRWPKGETALMLAAQHGYQDMIELLLQHGANRNLRNVDGQNAENLATSETTRALLHEQ